MLIWKDRYGDILSCTLELVVITLVSEGFWVENKEMAVLHYLPDRLREAVNDLLGAFNSTLFKLLWIRLFRDTLLLQLVSDVVLHIVELGKHDGNLFVLIREEGLEVFKLLKL